MQQRGAEANEDDNLILVVQNTFLEAKTVPDYSLRRSQSDPSISSSQKSSSGHSGEVSNNEGATLSSVSTPRSLDFGEQPSASSASRTSSKSNAAGAKTALPTTIKLASLTSSPFDAVTVPSVGSLGHSEGLCHPCSYFLQGLCKLGTECGFCHLGHGKRDRPGKKGRQRERARLEKQGVEVPKDKQLWQVRRSLPHEPSK
jgi:hypothetical protein